MKVCFFLIFLFFLSSTLWTQVSIYDKVTTDGEFVLGLGIGLGDSILGESFFKDDASAFERSTPIFFVDFNSWGRFSNAGKFDNLWVRVGVSPAVPISQSEISELLLDVGYQTLWGVKDSADYLILSGIGFNLLFQNNYSKNLYAFSEDDAETFSTLIAAKIDLSYVLETQIKLDSFRRIFWNMTVPLVSYDTLIQKYDIDFFINFFVPTQVSTQVGFLWGTLRESRGRLYSIFNRLYYEFSFVNNIGSISVLQGDAFSYYSFKHSIGINFFVD